jgi:excisionase family DNA binding protein
MQDTMTIREAAEFLGVSRTKVWSLIKEGRLTATQNPLDKRERLIPGEEIRQLQQQSMAPRRHLLPKTVGLYDGPVTVHSDEYEDYLKAHWRPS